MSASGGTGQGISVVTDALRTYSGISRTMSAEVATAAGGRALTSQAELAGAFGPIGKGFLAAFHKAEAAHLQGASKVSIAHGAMATQSQTSAAAYDGTDADSAALTGAVRTAMSLSETATDAARLASTKTDPPTDPQAV